MSQNPGNEVPRTTEPSAPGLRKLPQYITDQLLLAIDNVRMRRMNRSDMEFEQCTIKVYRTGMIVRVDLVDKQSNEAAGPNPAPSQS